MLLVLSGPPAVGKMTVGRAIADASGFTLFHNHATIEPLLEVFGSWDHPAFTLLKDEFRVRVLEEAARHAVDLIFTFVWPVDDAADADIVRSYIRPFEDAGQEVVFVELDAGLDARLERNRGETRLTEKKSKRDLAWSDAHVRDVAATRMTTDPGDPGPADAVIAGHRHLRLDTSALSAEETAGRILAWLGDPAPSLTRR